MRAFWVQIPLLYWILAALLLIAVGLDTVTYDGFVRKHFIVDSRLFFLPLLALSLYMYMVTPGTKMAHSKQLIQFNYRILLPVSTISTIVFTALEYSFYPNFVYSTFHIHYDYLLYPFLFSLLTTVFFMPKKILYKFQNELFFILSLVLISIGFLIRLWPNDTFFYLSREDHAFENLQVIFYLLASFFFCLQSVKQYKNKQYVYSMFFIGFSLFLFFVAGEEISWGQRILGIQSSEYLRIHNVQKETTVHNLKGLQEYQFLFYMIFSFSLSTSWAVLKILPIKLRHFLKPLIPSWYFSTYFLPIFMFYFLINVVGNTHSEWQEFVELLLALGLFLFSLTTNLEKPKKALKPTLIRFTYIQ